MTTLQAEAGSRRVVANERTLFVIGNGPSLKGVDLTRLSPYATLGMNAAYRYWREIDWRPKIYACLDLVVGMSHREEIAELIREGRIKTFLLRANLIDALGEVACDARVVNFDVLQRRHALLRVPAVTTGSHSALWGAFAGYSQIIMLGIDARYRELVAGAASRGGAVLEIVSAQENPNYFFDSYQQPGDKYHLPNPRPGLHVDAWREVARKTQDAGVEVYNANPASAVRCFKFVSLDDVLGAGAEPAPAEESVGATADGAGDGGDAMAGSRLGRLAFFIGKSMKPLAVAGGSILIAAAIFYLTGDRSFASLLCIAVASGLFGALTLFVLLLRYSLVMHVTSLDQRITAMEEGMREVDRQSRIREKESKAGRTLG